MTGHLGVERSDRSPWTPWGDDEPSVSNGTRPVRVYCLPHAGGSAGAYLELARSYDAPGLRFVPVELPGRGTRRAEPLTSSMNEVVDGILSMLAGRPPQENFLLFGHSMGARMAYETTRRLAAADRPLPRALVVSSSRPPHAPVPLDLYDDDEQFVAEVVKMGGVPAELLEHPSLLRLLLPAMRADVALVHGYAERAPRTPLPCPVVALTGADDRHAGVDWISGWRSLTTSTFRCRVFPGDHFFLIGQEAEVAAEIAQIAEDSVPAAQV